MMSGGVDSSVAASLLVKQGHNVTGVFMKCWSLEQLAKLGIPADLYGCFWEDDARDAQLVADKLGIPFEVWDLQDEYMDKVVTYMVQEYKVGRTPNPDVMCNSTIKFGVFYSAALQRGAEYVATGHYAQRGMYQAQDASFSVIQKGADATKDQAYFLWRVQPERIPWMLFPLQQFASKQAVRNYATEHALVTAHKPDSQGLCFIGSTPLRDMLSHVHGTAPGDIVTTNWEHASAAKKLTKKDKQQFERDGYVTIGQHPGAALYTIGQRNQLGLSGGPWFVLRNDVAHNRLYVQHGTQQQVLQCQDITISDCVFHVPLQAWPRDATGRIRVESQIRYHGTIIACTVTQQSDTNPITLHIHTDTPHTAVAPGQGLVIYDANIMLGGGVIV